jgi:hypothetical protein
VPSLSRSAEFGLAELVPNSLLAEAAGPTPNVSTARAEMTVLNLVAAGLGEPATVRVVVPALGAHEVVLLEARPESLKERRTAVFGTRHAVMFGTE